jgi:SAM-dependent methyltransferase
VPATKLNRFLRQLGGSGRPGVRHPAWCLLTGRFNFGYCPICQSPTAFFRLHDWLRDFYVCGRCRSIPRWRAVMHLIETTLPGWRGLRIHECSPGGAASRELAAECAGYVATNWFADLPAGQYRGEVRCENLESLTFEDEAFDLVVTQDVLEHVLQPERAFAEIARTLKPGGAHVFTVPIYRGRPTQVCAVAGPHGIEHRLPPEYHGNPIDPGGSLVARRWGDDLPEFVLRHSGLPTEIHLVRDRRLGLDGEFLEVCISRKSPT